MQDEKKSKAQLIEELKTLRQRVSKLGAAETERRHAEEALLEAEETLYRLKKAVETTGVGITISDTTGRIIYTNPADAKIHGYEPEELIGQPSNIFATPEQRINENRRNDEDDIFQDWERERINMRKDGSIFPARLTSNPIYDTQKFHIGSVTVCEDISERKKTEKALNTSLQLLEKTFAGLEEAVFVIDASDRSIILCNPSIEHIFGYGEQEIFGKHISTLFNDQRIYKRFDKDLFYALDAKEVFHAECRMRRKDGNIFISEHTATEITEDSGIRSSVLMVVRDISERKQAEQELKKHHEHLEELVEERTADLTQVMAETKHLNEQLQQEIASRKHTEKILQFKNTLLSTQQETALDGILIVDALGRIVSFNQHFIDMWEIPADILKSQSDELVLQSVSSKLMDPERFLARIRHLYRHHSEKSHEELSLADGRTFTRYSAPMRREEGDYYGRVWYFRDITEQKQAEECLKFSLQEKDALLKEVHHRVKNNMQVISSLLNLQSTLLQDDRSQEILKESQDRIRSMALIHEKLYQSKTLTEIDFHDYVKTLAHDLYISYGPQTGKIRVTLRVDNIRLGIDIAIPCGLILNELVSNSLKHAFPEERGAISIEMKELTEGEYALTIGDDGVGISESFDIADSGTLGLQLVRGLVEEQLGGSMELQGTVGTVWTITFQNSPKGKPRPASH